MATVWQVITSWFSGPPPIEPSKKYDDGPINASNIPQAHAITIRTHGAPAVARPASSFATPPRPRQETAYVYFVHKCRVPVCVPTTDEARKTSPSMRADEPEEGDTDGSQRALGKERLMDKRDCVVQLSQLMHKDNLQPLKEDDDSASFVTRFANGYAAVFEIALLVTDPLWNPAEQYLLVHTTNVAPLQHSITALGDRIGVLKQSLASRNGTTNAPLNKPKQCVRNEHKGVPGWCVACGSRPNTITLYQSPVMDTDIIKYSAEIFKFDGTHGHVVKCTSAQMTRRRADDDDNDNDGQHDEDCIEINPASTLAADMCARGEAQFQPGINNASAIFVSRRAWRDELASVGGRVLFNLPLARLDDASIRIGARALSANLQHIDVTVVVRCLGVK